MASLFQTDPDSPTASIYHTPAASRSDSPIATLKRSSAPGFSDLKSDPPGAPSTRNNSTGITAGKASHAQLSPIQTVFRQPKRIIACCDGTWQDALVEEDLYSNVVRLSRCIYPEDRRNPSLPAIPQVVFYQSGIGTFFGPIDRYFSGATGVTLASKVREAYHFIAGNWVEGDEIFLFGFSRGAYTARTVASLIGEIGILSKKEMAKFPEIFHAYQMRHKKGKERREMVEEILRPFLLSNKENGRHSDARWLIKCVGVWDTVGSLGIPGFFKNSSLRRFFGFTHTDLGEHIQYGFHALALNETRADFEASKWVQTDRAREKGQVMKQVWFAGSHGDIGGGYPDHDLADISLTWMAANLSSMISLDLSHLFSVPHPTQSWGQQKPHDSRTGAFKATAVLQREYPIRFSPQTNEYIHASVMAQRHLSPQLEALQRKYFEGEHAEFEPWTRWATPQIGPVTGSGSGNSPGRLRKSLSLSGISLGRSRSTSPNRASDSVTGSLGSATGQKTSALNDVSGNNVVTSPADYGSPVSPQSSLDRPPSPSLSERADIEKGEQKDKELRAYLPADTFEPDLTLIEPLLPLENEMRLRWYSTERKPSLVVEKAKSIIPAILHPHTHAQKGRSQSASSGSDSSGVRPKMDFVPSLEKSPEEGALEVVDDVESMDPPLFADVQDTFPNSDGHKRIASDPVVPGSPILRAIRGAWTTVGGGSRTQTSIHPATQHIPTSISAHSSPGPSPALLPAALPNIDDLRFSPGTPPKGEEGFLTSRHMAGSPQSSNLLATPEIHGRSTHSSPTRSPEPFVPLDRPYALGLVTGRQGAESDSEIELGKQRLRQQPKPIPVVNAEKTKGDARESDKEASPGRGEGKISGLMGDGFLSQIFDMIEGDQSDREERS